MKRIMGMAVVLGILAGSLHGMDHAGSSRQQQAYGFKEREIIPHAGTDFVAVCPNNTTILSVSPYDKSVYVIKLGEDTLSTMKYAYTHAPRHATCASDSSKAAVSVSSSETECGFSILDLEKENDYTEQYAKDMQCRFIAFTPDNEQVIAVNEDEVRIVNYTTGEQKKIESGMQNAQEEASKDPIAACFLKEATLYALLRSGVAKRVNVTTGESVPSLNYSPVKMLPGRWGTTVSASDERVAIINNNQHNSKKDVISVHDIKTGECISQLSRKETLMMGQVALSPNGKKLAHNEMATGQVGNICIANVDRAATDDKQILIRFCELATGSIAFSPDSDCLLAVSGDGEEASIFNARDGSKLYRFVLRNFAESGCFSPDGSMALVPCGSNHGELLIAHRFNLKDAKGGDEDECELDENPVDSDDDDPYVGGNRISDACLIL
jgi:WD40 repeat protein